MNTCWDVYINGEFKTRVWYFGYLQRLLDTCQDVGVVEIARDDPQQELEWALEEAASQRNWAEIHQKELEAERHALYKEFTGRDGMHLPIADALRERFTFFDSEIDRLTLQLQAATEALNEIADGTIYEGVLDGVSVAMQVADKGLARVRKGGLP